MSKMQSNPSLAKPNIHLYKEFVPHPYLLDAHLMTIMTGFVKRKYNRVRESSKKRLFQVAPDSQIIAYCHFQPDAKNVPTVLILHGLEGSAESPFVNGIAEKALFYGLNVVRMNMRNCGGGAKLTPTLYNAGLSADLIAVLQTLKNDDGLKDIFVVGCSLGGNLALKAAGELGDQAGGLLAGVCAISPSIDLLKAVEAIELPQNKIYDQWFLFGLKQKIKDKDKLFPGRFDCKLLKEVKTLRHFDHLFTAIDAGYKSAEEYYFNASALRVMDKIRIPTLLIAAEDDPIVPFASFDFAHLNNSFIQTMSARHGGHCGFFAKDKEEPDLFDNFWAENRALAFCLANI